MDIIRKQALCTVLVGSQRYMLEPPGKHQLFPRNQKRVIGLAIIFTFNEVSLCLIRVQTSALAFTISKREHLLIDESVPDTSLSSSHIVPLLNQYLCELNTRVIPIVQVSKLRPRPPRSTACCHQISRGLRCR